MENTETLCTAAWSNVHITPDGRHTPCCLWPNKLEFNRPQLQQNMLQGIPSIGCASCRKQEENKQNSLREHFNNKLPGTDNITSVDLSVDNVCNMECLMCSSEYSHKAAKRERDLLGKSVVGDTVLKNQEYKNLDWQYINTVKLFGGEPLMSPGVQDFLSWSKEHINWHNIHLEIITNNSVPVSKEFDQLFRMVKSLHITVSKDGLDTVNQLQRQGMISLIEEHKHFDYWNNLAENRSNVSLAINSAVSIYTALDQDTLIRWTEKNYDRFDVHLEMVQSPGWLNIQNMPNNLKFIYSNNIQDQRILDWMLGDGDSKHFEQFLMMNKHAENLYNIDIENEIPLLHAYIRNLHSTSNMEQFKDMYNV